VPLDENLETWQVSVTNHRDTPARLSAFSLVEFCLWDAYDDMTNFQRNFSTGQVEIDDGVIYHKTEYRERRNHFAYFACSERWPGSTPSANRSSAPIAGLITRWSSSGASRPIRSRMAGHPSDRTISGWTSNPAKRAA